MQIHQDAKIYLGRYKQKASHELPVAKRNIWVQMIQGIARINGAALSAGDGIAISNEKMVTIQAEKDTEFLLFDLQ